MFEVPRAFGAFDSLFKNLGTTQAPTASDYAVFLKVGFAVRPSLLFRATNAAHGASDFIARVSMRRGMRFIRVWGRWPRRSASVCCPQGSAEYV